MSCAERRADIDREFAGEAVDAVALSRHLETCPACREYREKLATVDTTLEKGGLGEGRQNSIEARLFARLNVPAPAPRVPTPEPRRRRSPGAVYGLVALAAAVLVFFLFPRSTGDDGFAPRGVKGDVFGVRAFCVQNGSVVAEARAGQTLRCGDGQFIQLTYTTPSAGQLSIALDGDEQLTPAVTQWQVDAGIDQALSFSTPVGDWLSRPRTVVAKFRDAKGAEVESTLTVTRQ